jgi:hypothetical protein
MPRAVIMMTSTRQRLALAVALIAIATLVVWYANQIAPHISDLASGWSQAYLFPMLNPVGADFRAGVYFPGSLLVSGKDPYVGSGLWYPPFSALFLLPYQIFNVAQAYSIHVVVVVLLTIASVWMSIRIAGLAFSNRASSPEAGERGTSIPLFLSLTFLALSSYGFLFSVERGNIDAYPLAFCLAGLWVLVRYPKRLWLQVILFSAAAHLKVYPAVLLPLLVWKHGWKSLPAIVVVNAVLLFCLGPGPALRFFGTLSVVTAYPGVWVGNHSAASFGQMLVGFIGERWGLAIPGIALVILPLAIWSSAAFVLVRRGYSASGAAWLFAIAVPLMNLIPSTSHDYKLVLLVAPLAMLLTFLLEESVTSGRRVALAQIVCACGLLILVSVSYTVVPPVLGNKYPFIFALQLLLAWVALASPATLPEAKGMVAGISPSHEGSGTPR